MPRRRATLTVLLICWLMILGVATPAHADRVSVGPASYQIDAIGWVLQFDLAPNSSGNIRATLRYMVDFAESDGTEDVYGEAGVVCEQHAYAQPYRCLIPDMPHLILKRSGGAIDLSTMELPLGNLDVCGSISTAAGGDPLYFAPSVSLVATSSPDLYGLVLNSSFLTLTHSASQTSTGVGTSPHDFHLMLPDTSLVAPSEYVLELQPEIVDHYTLHELTIVDPGAFVHGTPPPTDGCEYIDFPL